MVTRRFTFCYVTSVELSALRYSRTTTPKYETRSSYCSRTALTPTSLTEPARAPYTLCLPMGLVVPSMYCDMVKYGASSRHYTRSRPSSTFSYHMVLTPHSVHPHSTRPLYTVPLMSSSPYNPRCLSLYGQPFNSCSYSCVVMGGHSVSTPPTCTAYRSISSCCLQYDIG